MITGRLVCVTGGMTWTSRDPPGRTSSYPVLRQQHMPSATPDASGQIWTAEIHLNHTPVITTATYRSAQGLSSIVFITNTR